MGGALAVYFLRNTFRAFQYTRLMTAKNKTLFHMLTLSQLVGVVVSIVFLLADFFPQFNCTAVGVLKKGGVLLSSTLLVPGILGTKAYRCLSDAGFVIVVLCVLRSSIIAVSGIVMAEYRGARRFTGTCETVNESSLLPISIFLQFAESCFICLCFLYAVYRSYRSPAEIARLSLPLTSDGSDAADDRDRRRDTRRGWWDYVPSPNNTTGEKRAAPGPPFQGTCLDTGINRKQKCASHRFHRWLLGNPTTGQNAPPTAPSHPEASPSQTPPRTSAVSIVVSPSRPSIIREPDCPYPRASSPPPPSVMNRIIRYVPRAEVFRTMLRNELLYTTFITTVLLAIGVIMLIGVTQQLLLGANSWIMLDWLVLSLCTMHSFSRVAHRHEREAWLQDPVNWRAMRRAEVEDITALRPKRAHRSWSPVSVDWHQHIRHRHSDDPSEPAHHRSAADMSEFTTTSPTTDPPAPSSPGSLSVSSSRQRARSTSFIRSPRSQIRFPVIPSSASSSCPHASLSPSPSPPPTPIRALTAALHLPPSRVPNPGSPAILPSPEWPSTAVSTPRTGDTAATAPGLGRSSSTPGRRSRRGSASTAGRGARWPRARSPDFYNLDPDNLR
ncbi:uncharacterized protein BXZ73DRAFT_39547 [Epithele typhae]|uniref:uncharacterized protein n=1 Tax=Epithele typhae TaxID=378194 RepID=UPI0020080F6D|nr:uncharacterized protein BXZ73DRAFT_39547 [Epithele typhae]KAH9944488.1 hypothetical protein BXZ73DRAFT_39547 [Epithele typhae]